MKRTFAGWGLALLAAFAHADHAAYATLDLEWHDDARERDVPVRLYWPEAASAAKPVPLIVFSHGIGGSRMGYSWLGRHWASQGYASLHVQHVGSDRSLWGGNPFAMVARLQGAARESEALARVADLRFATDALLASPKGALIDTDRIAVAGHSYGANTAMLAVGARVERDGRPVALRDPRFKAAVLISAPPFYGESDFRTILKPIDVPTLHVTATDDVIRIPGYYSPSADRIAVYDAVGGARKWLAVFQGGSHSMFTDRLGAGGSALNPQVKAATQELSAAFLSQLFDRGDAAADAVLRAWPTRFSSIVLASPRRHNSGVISAVTAAQRAPDSRYAAWRLAAALALMTIGSAGMYVVAVVLPAVQAEFGVARSDASLPYTALLIGFGIGGVIMGRLADRFGVMVPVLLGAAGLALGFAGAAIAGDVYTFSAVHAVLIGMLGSSATFAPLVADTSAWWIKRRGIAVAICASGNYLAGATWPPIVQRIVEAHGWRTAYVVLAVVCAVLMPLLALALRERAPAAVAAPPKADAPVPSERPFGLPMNAATALLALAGVACCVAMSMPQVHIVAYCTDLGYGAARGAEMLSLMLACGIVSRLVSGWICDRIGGLRTLLLGSVLQGIALLLFLPFDGLASLYAVSALFGLFQGGIVPSYAIIIREHFPAASAGTRVGIVLTATLLGMALGGWMSGAVFDLTGSYDAAFVNGIGWNVLNLGIVLMLLRGSRRKRHLEDVHDPAAVPQRPHL